MKKILLMFVAVVLLSAAAQAQKRDRRVAIDYLGHYHVGISTTGQIWIGNARGEIWMADSLGASFHQLSKTRVNGFYGDMSIERIAAFGPSTAVVAGYLRKDGNLLRTTTGGAQWDTLAVDKDLVWVHGFSMLPDGHLWLAASSGRSHRCMVFSIDSGRTYKRIDPPFANPMDREGGIKELFMCDADSGFACTYAGDIYSTSDNWRSSHRMFTPYEQGVVEKGVWISRIRPWKQSVLVAIGKRCFALQSAPNFRWEELDFADFEVDAATGRLWALTDSGQLALMTDDQRRRQILRDGISGAYEFCGIHDGNAYLSTAYGVVRVMPDGHSDTCGLFTEDQTIDDYYNHQKELTFVYTGGLHAFNHGGRMWYFDNWNVCLKDALGLYRIAHIVEPGMIMSMLPHPTQDDRVVMLFHDNKNYVVDTSGRIEPFVYNRPLDAFIAGGLQKVSIETYHGGCFSFRSQMIHYERDGNRMVSLHNTFDTIGDKVYFYPADSLESALQRLNADYSRFPSPADFGLRDGDVNLEKVYSSRFGGCTNFSGYQITFINGNGDTLYVKGRSDIDCGHWFPWLLPMQISGNGFAFVSYQPVLWQALRPMMPTQMYLREHLDNRTIVQLRPGMLLFFSDNRGMGAAVQESTGRYSHVAMVESVGDTVWIIDATPKHGVARRPLVYSLSDPSSIPDIYCLDVPFDTAATFSRARASIGLPYDHAFLPDNGAIYCSELIAECYRDAHGNRLFPSQPMNWRNAKGKLPRFWRRHFRKLGIPVPEGVPGTNPTDLSRSPILYKLGLQK